MAGRRIVLWEAPMPNVVGTTSLVLAATIQLKPESGMGVEPTLNRGCNPVPIHSATQT